MLFLTLSIVFPMLLMAADVTPAQALQQAQNFVKSRTSFTGGPRRAPGTVPQMKQPRRVKGLYVFNMSKGGFVVVSNDDRTRPILGFSDSGSFDPDNMPANMRHGCRAMPTRLPGCSSMGAVATLRLKPPTCPLWGDGTPPRTVGRDRHRPAGQHDMEPGRALQQPLSCI